MADDRPNSANDSDSGGRQPRNAYAVLLVVLTLVFGIAAIIFVRPHVARWLEVRSAYRNLSKCDVDAVHWLVRHGENPEPALIALLHHPEPEVRRFAADELCARPSTSEIVEAFLVALETNQHVAEIGEWAPAVFSKHARDATGPLTETDQRMIAWLRTELNSTSAEQSGNAAFALLVFARRNPSLKEPVVAYLKNGAESPTSNHKFLVLREMAECDLSMRDQYVDVLLSGLASSAPTDQFNAQYGLSHFENAPSDLRLRLEARREESTDPDEISRIDQALESLPGSNAEAR